MSKSSRVVKSVRYNVPSTYYQAILSTNDKAV